MHSAYSATPTLVKACCVRLRQQTVDIKNQRLSKCMSWCCQYVHRRHVQYVQDRRSKQSIDSTDIPTEDNGLKHAQAYSLPAVNQLMTLHTELCRRLHTSRDR